MVDGTFPTEPKRLALTDAEANLLRPVIAAHLRKIPEAWARIATLGEERRVNASPTMLPPSANPEQSGRNRNSQWHFGLALGALHLIDQCRQRGESQEADRISSVLFAQQGVDALLTVFHAEELQFTFDEVRKLCSQQTLGQNRALSDLAMSEMPEGGRMLRGIVALVSAAKTKQIEGTADTNPPSPSASKSPIEKATNDETVTDLIATFIILGDAYHDLLRRIIRFEELSRSTDPTVALAQYECERKFAGVLSDFLAIGKKLAVALERRGEDSMPLLNILPMPGYWPSLVPPPTPPPKPWLDLKIALQQTALRSGVKQRDEGERDGRTTTAGGDQQSEAEETETKKEPQGDEIELDGTGELIVDAMRRNGIDSVGERKLGRDIANLASAKFNTHFKATLSHLRQAGVLANPGRGYYLTAKGKNLYQQRKVRTKSG